MLDKIDVIDIEVHLYYIVLVLPIRSWPPVPTTAPFAFGILNAATKRRSCEVTINLSIQSLSSQSNQLHDTLNHYLTYIKSLHLTFRYQK